MTSAGEPFVITINLKNVTGAFDDWKFTMLIDCRKMTIVYEVTEWIRWMFSIESCILLMHDNGIIHDLEDIVILEVLKTFTVKLCPGNRCIHKKSYKTLLETIDFYSMWNQVQVPKIFVEKLGLINEKLCSKTLSTPISDYKKKLPVENYSICSQTNNADELFSVKRRKMNDEKQCEKLNTGSSESVQVKISPVKVDQKFNDNRKTYENNGAILTNTDCPSQNSIDHCENKMSKNVSLGHMINSETISDEKDLSDTCKPVIPRKRKKCLKPFSLAEMLASLREENQKGLLNKSSPGSAVEDGDASPTNLEENGAQNDFECVRRKRKRVRKKKNKNKNLLHVDDAVDMELSYEPSQITNVIQVHEKSASHIRFSSFSEDDDNEEESKQNKSRINAEVDSSTPVITPGPEQDDKNSLVEMNCYESSNIEKETPPHNSTNKSQLRVDNFDMGFNNLLNEKFSYPKVYQRYN